MKVENLNRYNGIYSNILQANKTDVSQKKQVPSNVSNPKKENDFSLTMDKLKKNTSAQREDKIASIKIQIENGTYMIDSRKLARAILYGETNI